MDLLGVLSAWYQHWMSLSVGDHAANALAGVVGGSMYSAWSNPVIKMPTFDRVTGELRLNFVGILIISMVVAVIVDTGFVVAIIAGTLATPLFTVIVRRFLPGLADAINAVIRARGGAGGYYDQQYGGGYGAGQYGDYGPQGYGQDYGAPPAQGDETVPPIDTGDGRGDVQ